jgi:hypothetical protein
MKNIDPKALLLSILITLAISAMLYFLSIKPFFLIYTFGVMVFVLTVKLIYNFLTNKKQKL